MQAQSELMTMIDMFDASHDRLRLAVARALSHYDEDELFDCLSDPEPILRTAAARRLQVRGTRSAFDRTLKLLDHPRFEQREIGAFVLGQFGTPDCPYADDTFRLIPQLLSDPYVEVQAAAAEAAGSLAMLGHQPPRSVLVPLIAQSRSPEPDLRAAVAFALGMVRDDAALACLREMAEDEDPDVRDMVETALEWHRERADEGSGPVPDQPGAVGIAARSSSNQKVIRSANG
jgi:HEAT repeat protein